MQNLRFFIFKLPAFLLLVFLTSCTGKKTEESGAGIDKTGNLQIGWSSVDLTPDKPVLLAGQFHARVSEGVLDPITATALAFEYGSGETSDKVIMISCDLVSISDGGRDRSPDNLRDNVRKILKNNLPEVRSDQIFLNATHTHTAPNVGTAADTRSIHGVELDVMTPAECLNYVSARVAKVAEEAWKKRQPGGISYGLGQAVVGHNRHTVDMDGRSIMYRNANFPEFSHVEGYEDHSVNLLYTWDKNINLTGIIINVPCPSQVTEGLFMLSADYWNEARVEVRKRLGKNIYILPQCSAAGDQAPHIQVAAGAEERMQRLIVKDSIKAGRTSMAQRVQIGLRIADAVTSVLPYMKDNIEWDPVFEHRMIMTGLSRRKAEKVDKNAPDATRKILGLVDKTTPEAYEQRYNQLLKEITENPDLKKKPRWYVEITNAYAKMSGRGRTKSSPSEKTPDKLPVEIHVVRLGDIVIATNPFELYLDYGIRIKGRSPAVQTFIVQLTGSGSYLPSARAVAGGSYGAATTAIGPEGGQELVENTLELINTVWQK
jgi:hypothetical protein